MLYLVFFILGIISVIIFLILAVVDYKTHGDMWTIYIKRDEEIYREIDVDSNCKNDRSQNEKQWTCECGQVNEGKYCSSCGKEKVDNQNEKQWTCECGQANTGNYCQNCGNEK